MKACENKLLEGAPDAQIRAAAKMEGDSWRHTLHMSALDLRVDDVVIGVATGLPWYAAFVPTFGGSSKPTRPL